MADGKETAAPGTRGSMPMGRGPGGRGPGRKGMPPIGPKVENPGKIFKRLMAYVMKQYGWQFMLVFVCIGITVFSSVRGTLFQQTLIDDFITPMIGQQTPDFSALLREILIVAGIYGLGVIAVFAQNRIMLYVTQGVLKKLRDDIEYKSIPVIMATAKGQDYDRIKGLDLGADDYLVKPFNMMEMVSRVKAVLRRTQPMQVSQLLKVGGLIVNLDEHTVIADGNRILLTYKEFELLRMFLTRPGMVFSREQLFMQVWNVEYMGDSRTLDMHIRTLRQKLGEYGKMIETVRNVGYRWEVAYDK